MEIFGQPIPPSHWVEAKESSLEEVMKLPIRYSRLWVRDQVARLIIVGVALTYTPKP